MIVALVGRNGIDSLANVGGIALAALYFIARIVTIRLRLEYRDIDRPYTVPFGLPLLYVAVGGALAPD
jgi:hypothetical protein